MAPDLTDAEEMPGPEPDTICPTWPESADTAEVGKHTDGWHWNEQMVARWVKIAASQAMLRGSDDPPGLIATVMGIEGAWGYGATREEALEDLKSVLVDWVGLKLQDGDDDIPSMEGLHLAVAG